MGERQLFFLKSFLHRIDKFYHYVDEPKCDFLLEKLNITDDICDKLKQLISLAEVWCAGSIPSNGFQSSEHKPQLRSIFNKIDGGHFTTTIGLNPLSIQRECVLSETQSNYQILWDSFSKEFDTLNFDSFQCSVESLTFLLKKYTWCIPCDTDTMQDVSLFEYSKLTAAFADCFYQYCKENGCDPKCDGDQILHKEGIRPVLLLGGDLSGIQNFIYNISSKKAAVSLKGRSFYLQLLIDSIIQRIISHPDIDATIVNVVYSSGGKFYMLLPNTKKVRTAVDDLRNEFAQKLWDEHKGGLLLNMDYVPFAFDCQTKEVLFEGAEAGSKIGGLWKALADKLAACKSTRFKSVIHDDFGELFTPRQVSPDDKVCAVTGVEGKCEKIGGGGDAVWVLPSVKKQCKLGEVLKDADYIITYMNPEVSKLFKNKWTFDIDIMGVHTYLFDKLELINENAEFRGISSADVCRVKCINSLMIPQLKGKSCSYGFQFYGGNNQAVTSYGDNKTFEELADGEYLGILRMDVDNLGAIFIKGLPEEAKSFAAYSTLSFMLDWFFSGYLNTIRAQEEFKGFVNILYSGGDDVFAIGKWDKIILFAESIRKAFAKFVGRDDISISAGIVIADAKYPIAKMAQLAGDAEDEAKKFAVANLPKKNALNLFGENISWQREFDFVKRYKGEFVDLICNENMPRSILHKLMTLCQKMDAGDMSYMWHSAYYLKRFVQGKSRPIVNFCQNLKTELCDKRKFKLITIGARWAEIELRKKNINND